MTADEKANVCRSAKENRQIHTAANGNPQRRVSGGESPQEPSVLHENPRVLIAAPGSGSGKTLIACALLKALKNRGMDVRAFKCGPDYIDPMFHRTVIGIPSENLDLFFAGEAGTREIFGRYAGDISVIEGVMGLYDGMGVTSDRASSYHLAGVLQAPVILVVDAKGMGRSVLALIKGFLSMDTEHLIRGVILNRIPESLCRTLKPMIETETGVRVLGSFPQNDRFRIESRHLGLQMPEEIRNLEDTLSEAADTLEKSADVDGILAVAGVPIHAGEEKNRNQFVERFKEPSEETFKVKAETSPEKICRMQSEEKTEKTEKTQPPLSKGSVEAAEKKIINNRENKTEGETGVCTQNDAPYPRTVFPAASRVRIGIARDRAFCFYYNENIRILESLGAEPVYFSPLSDRTLPPDLDGLLLGGGYPELFAAQLSANTSMPASIRQAVLGGLPTVAECGGFMYLHDRLTAKDGISYPMAGVIRGEVRQQPKLVRFGYISLFGRGEDAKFAKRENDTGVKPEGILSKSGRDDGQKTTDDESAQDESAQKTSVKYGTDTMNKPNRAGRTDETDAAAGTWIPAGSAIRGHEFHYFDSTDNGADCLAVKPLNGRSWPCVHAAPTAFLGFPHLYYASCPAFAENFIKKCRDYANTDIR